MTTTGLLERIALWGTVTPRLSKRFISGSRRRGDRRADGASARTPRFGLDPLASCYFQERWIVFYSAAKKQQAARWQRLPERGFRRCIVEGGEERTNIFYVFHSEVGGLRKVVYAKQA